MSLRVPQARNAAEALTILRAGLSPPAATGGQSIAKAGKYRNVPTVIDGERFDSKLEGRCYLWLQQRQRSGGVAWFIRQPAFKLEGGVVYRADFLVVLAAGGVEVIDAKGMLTRSTANKLKQVRARFGIEVILWRKP